MAVWQAAAETSQEMDEIVRAMSAENERLLSATHDSQHRRHRHSSVSHVTKLSWHSLIILLLDLVFIYFFKL